MSEENGKPDPYQEQRQEALSQNGVLDAAMTVTKIIGPFTPLRGIHFGSTSFEGYDLNAMVDIVESANPELLESAGKALVDAKEAIDEAAEELRQNLGEIDWKGEAHTAFRTWGDSLVETAKQVAGYAETIGTQVMAAGSGLASVRKSMPPRDSRSDPKKVSDIPEAKQVETNDEYTAAVKAEGHRQEAINQMYRLASFYTVSAGTMRGTEEPVFPKMPDAGVPPGSPPSIAPVRPTVGGASDTPLGESGTATDRVVHGAVAAGTRGETPTQPLAAHKNVDLPASRPVGMEIDSVGTLPPQEAVRPNTVTPPTSGPAAPAGPVPPMTPGMVPPSLRGAGRRAGGPGGTSALRMPPSAQGRGGPGPVGQVPRGAAPGPAGGRGAGPAGPVGSRGTGPVGPVGRTAMPSQTGTGPMGRGIVGGVPKPAAPAPGPIGGGARGPVGPMGASPSGPAGSGSGRGPQGVVGGRPISGPTAGGGGSKLPRGTVIGGGGGAPAPRTTGQRPTQRGVIGAPTPSDGKQSSRRAVPGSDGVIGAPGSTRGAASKKKKGSDRRRSRRDEQRGDASATD
ncbi:WXG100 family type VII secretion target [Streptomyces tagetis]|uniref:WXG100 family type VII secretion target n=1 Tax=Streptomyces tagetis TaxID=2820809 RepID=A0A940XNP4_9ACTN|nr:WXG100 family type VII secretion target [Streptomyces sp. RG38]MBQ0830947.1 WXG100 family type VII secretion target [Streptomyces sp. RG38]